MDFRNDKLCLRLLYAKNKHSKLSKSDRKHLDFLEKENINILGELDSLEEILISEGYLKPKHNNTYDENRIRIDSFPLTTIDDGISFYKKYSEIKKISKENRNQLFTTFKNYWWGIALLFGGLYALLYQWKEIKEWIISWL